MAELTVTVGLLCSGKNEYIEMLAKETGAYVASIDDNDSDVNETLDKLRCCLAYGYNCILDGTYTKSSQRKDLLKKINAIMPGIPYKKICVIVATPIERVFYNNISRGSKTDNKIIWEQYKNWQTPSYWEGWDEIWAYYADQNWIGIRGEYGKFAETHTAFDLNDKDRFDSLGGHCNSVHNHLLRLLQTRDPKGKDELREKSLLAASLIHDCGKPIVETREEGKSLYYNHSNVGAYEALFYKIDTGADFIYVSDLVNYHMDPYDWEKAASRAYAVKNYGGEFVEDLSLLHQADEMAKEKR